MNTPPLPIDESKLAAALAAAPELDLGHGGLLVASPPNPLRNDSARRRLFLWSVDGQIRYHVVAGPRAADEFEKTRAFHQAHPSIGVRPAALLNAADTRVAVLEHVEGPSLESALASGAISIPQAESLLDQLLDALDSSAEPSDSEAALRELDSLRLDLLAIPALGPLDALFFDHLLFPLLRAGLPDAPCSRRWSNGDFVARNLLLDPHGRLRLIDFEFASPSALAASDAFRFGEFSAVPDELKAHVRRRLPGDPRWWSLLFCAAQLRKLSAVRPPDAFLFDAEDLLLRLLRETLPADSLPRPSCLFRSRTDSSSLARHSQDLQTRYDDLSRHSLEAQSRYDELQAHAAALRTQYEELSRHSRELQAQYGELLTKYNELLAHSNTLQSHYDSLAAHARNLQTAADENAARAARADAERDSLSARIAHTPRPARWFIPR